MQEGIRQRGVVSGKKGPPQEAMPDDYTQEPLLQSNTQVPVDSPIKANTKTDKNNKAGFYSGWFASGRFWSLVFLAAGFVTRYWSIHAGDFVLYFNNAHFP